MGSSPSKGGLSLESISAWLVGRSDLRKLIANTFWLSADRILRLLVGLLMGAWMARYLGKDRFGLYGYVISLVSLFGPVAGLGLDSVVVRELVLEPMEKDEILGTAFLLKLGGGVIAWLGATTAMSLLRPGDVVAQSIVVIVAIQMLLHPFTTIDLWFQAGVRSKYTVWASGVAVSLANVIKVVLLLGRAPLVAFAWAFAVEFALSAIATAVAYHMTGGRFGTWRFGSARAKGLLRSCWPLVASGMAIAVYMRFDQIMLGQMAGDEAVGIYAAAIRVSEVWHFVPMAIATSVFPALVDARRQRGRAYAAYTQSALLLMSVLSYSVAIPVTLRAGWIVRGLYGAEYAEAGTALAIHIWSGAFVSSGVIASGWLIAEDLIGLSLLAKLAGAATSVALNSALLPRYGVVGAAVATLGSYSVSACGLHLLHPRARRLFLFQAKAFAVLPAVGAVRDLLRDVSRQDSLCG